MVSEIKLEEKWSLKRLSSHASWGCWLDQYRERLDKEAGKKDTIFISKSDNSHMTLVSHLLFL